ncbi:hypothetical protein BDV93DRAFT_514279 [Ceratobasidium sp. AG-I]|nr:hypothetical protein BDV93DRAFT_514279 [Ceratobasidium sp. AG-I]
MPSDYLNVDYGSKHLLFYFSESCNNPSTSPVLLWVGVGFSHAGSDCPSYGGLSIHLVKSLLRAEYHSHSGAVRDASARDIKRLSIPHDKPKEALAMVHRWLGGEEL